MKRQILIYYLITRDGKPMLSDLKQFSKDHDAEKFLKRLQTIKTRLMFRAVGYFYSKPSDIYEKKYGYIRYTRKAEDAIRANEEKNLHLKVEVATWN